MNLEMRQSVMCLYFILTIQKVSVIINVGHDINLPLHIVQHLKYYPRFVNMLKTIADISNLYIKH